MPLIDIFPDPEEMKLSSLMLMMAVYGYVLCRASAVIGDGSEMLMLIFGPGIVGGLVVPLLGAIPDCAVILISGMGEGTPEEVQHQLSVGIGTLVGSTVMLLTVPYGMGILMGRRDYDESRDCATTHKPKLTHFSLWTNCVTALDDIPATARVMLLSLAGYLVIQLPSFWHMNDADGGVKGEHPWALGCMIWSIVCFVGYCTLQVWNSQTEELERRKQEQLRHAQWKNKLDHSLGQQKVQEMVFRMHDKDGSGYIEPEELSHALAHLGLQVGRKDMKELMDSIDVGNHEDGDAGKADGRVSLKEFQAAVNNWVNAGQKGAELHRRTSTLQRLGSQKSIRQGLTKEQDGKTYGSVYETKESARKHNKKMQQQEAQQAKGASGKGESKDDDAGKDVEAGHSRRHSCGMDDPADKHADDSDDENVDEEEEEEDEYWELSDTELLIKAVLLLLFGTFTVTMFSDPMVDVITQVGDRLDVSPFYVAFVVTPLAANASEVYAGILFARKKTNESISMTLATLHGAATMNNTLALAIFMCIIYFRGLRWDYTAEVAAVLIVVVLVGLNTLWRRTVFLWQGLLALALYPSAILFVYTMQALGVK